jgi:hypothetical protein
MFTIRFNPAIAKWQVCMLKWGLFWWPIKDAAFDTYHEAGEWVGAIGLADQYDEKVYKGANVGLMQGVR